MAFGDALALVGPYTVSNEAEMSNVVFWQAMADADETDQAIPVKVRGICIFGWRGRFVPTVDGVLGVSMASENFPGVVEGVEENDPTLGDGLNLKVDGQRVHVLL